MIRLLRGGFWRNFLVKYPELADAYWKMLSLSRTIHAALDARPGDPRLLAAREWLWRGQANDAYWHGVFGGCYLPHLRRAVRSALIESERRLAEAGAVPAVQCEAADHNGDGRVEVRLRTPELALTIDPAAGGSITELVFFPAGMDLADVLARRRESYHGRIKEAEASGAGADDGARSIHDRLDAKEAGLAALVQYDVFRRASLLDGLFPAGSEPLDALQPWEAARPALGAVAMSHATREDAAGIGVTLRVERPDGAPLSVEKSVTVPRSGARVAAKYRLRWDGIEPLVARWAVQVNLTLTAGDALGRYYRLPGQPSLGSHGAAEGQLGVAMVDEWLGCELDLRWPTAAELGWAPVETVSLSEAGFERIYQGSAVLVAWTIRLAPGESWETEIALSARRLSS
jgi:alpha-amylase